MTKEELQKKAMEMYTIHEDDPQIIRNIRECEQKAYIQGYDDAKKKLVHAPNDQEGITAEELRHQMHGYELAKKELGWHKYPEEKPTEEARVFVNIKGKYFESRIFSEGSFGMIDRAVVAWMPIPEEGGER